jgi:hypothetical protein
MFYRTCIGFILLAAIASPVTGLRAADAPPYAGCAAAEDEFFNGEVWAKVAAQSCLKCHKPGGDAEESKLVLIDPARMPGAETMRKNRDAFAAMARVMEGGDSRLLLKSIGRLEHKGEDVLQPDSEAYRVLAEFVRRINAPASLPAVAEEKNAPPFFDGVLMLDDRRLLRRVTLSLAGRLPTDAEFAAVSSGGLKALPALLDTVMKEDAFFLRLREAFNDLFLTTGLDDNAETVLSYDHFEKTRGWAEKHDLSHIKDEKARQQARYKLYDDYRAALDGEPMKLIEHIVRHDRPLTEIVTADYIMVTPYSARGYGIYDELKPKFKNPDDPFEYIPVRLKALKARNKSDDQESATGFYPHAGLLSTFQYLRRYPTTETNRNRQRARVFYLHFLGVDVLELAARVSDAAAVTAKYENPTMQAAECVVCHRTVDPIAGLFQDYWRFEGVYGRRKEGWFTDMFTAGYEGENLPPQERWRALQWLGERTARDPRFAVAMVEHVVYMLTGRKALMPPKDIADSLFTAQRRAYQAQRKQVETIAANFAKHGFNLKNVIKDWIVSDFYRADGLATAAANPERRAELDDIGLMRMLAPEQVERKVAAIFGKPWGKLKHGDGGLDMLYGGLDSKEVTERAADPSGAMGAIQRILANDVACKQTALDFTRPRDQRLFFRHVEPDTLPGSSPEADAAIRNTIVHLHHRVLGRDDAPDAPEVTRTLYLFTGILSDAARRKDLDDRENYHCRSDLPGENYPDPLYTIRAWRAVMTFLLRQREFLYE